MKEMMTNKTNTSVTENEECIVVKGIEVNVDDVINDVKKATWMNHEAATEFVKALCMNEHTRNIVGDFVYDLFNTDVDICMTSTSVLKDIEIEPWRKNDINMTFSVFNNSENSYNCKFYSFYIILNNLGEYRYYKLNIH